MEKNKIADIMNGFDERFGTVTKKVTDRIKFLLERCQEVVPGKRIWQDALLAELEGDLLVLAATINEYINCRAHAETRSANGEMVLREIARFAVRLPGPRGLAVDAFAVMNREAEVAPQEPEKPAEASKGPACLNCGAEMHQLGLEMMSERDDELNPMDDQAIASFACNACGATMEFVYPK